MAGMVSALGLPHDGVVPKVYHRGKHCLLRPLTDVDIRRLYGQPDVMAVLAAYRPWYRSRLHPIEWMVQRQTWITSLDPPVEFEAVIVALSDETPVGFINLSGVDVINRKAELSMGLFARRGTKLGLEALHWVCKTSFETLHMHKLVCCVAADNAPAHRLLTRFGIGLEAILKEEMQADDGSHHDLCRYALFAAQWRQGAVRHRLEQLAPL